MAAPARQDRRLRSPVSPGLVFRHDSPANYVPVTSADNWLHPLLTVGMIALAVLLTRDAGLRTSADLPPPPPSTSAAATVEGTIGAQLKIPEPRGPVTAGLLSLLSGHPGADPSAQAHLHQLVTVQLPLVGDIIEDEDLQLALFCLYELHYTGPGRRGYRWEWNPDLIRVRHLLEVRFENALRPQRTSTPNTPACPRRKQSAAMMSPPSCSNSPPRAAGQACPAMWPKGRTLNNSASS